MYVRYTQAGVYIYIIHLIPCLSHPLRRGFVYSVKIKKKKKIKTKKKSSKVKKFGKSNQNDTQKTHTSQAIQESNNNNRINIK